MAIAGRPRLTPFPIGTYFYIQQETPVATVARSKCYEIYRNGGPLVNASEIFNRMNKPQKNVLVMMKDGKIGKLME